jgi:hypothetical protein
MRNGSPQSDATSRSIFKVGATRRLLNFFSGKSGAGIPNCGGEWMTESQAWIEVESQKEAELDGQMLTIFDKMRGKDG